MESNKPEQSKTNSYFITDKIVLENYLCNLDDINNSRNNIGENSEAESLFFYLANSISENMDSYEKIFYIRDNSMGFCIFENTEIKRFCELLNGMDIDAKAYIQFNQCHVQYTKLDEKDYLIIQSDRFSEAYFKDHNFMLDNNFNSKLVIYDYNHIYVEGKKRFYPATLKSLYKIDKEIVITMMEHFSSKNSLWKDIKKDYEESNYYCSISMELIWACHNKKELLEKKNEKKYMRLDISLSNSINKFPLKLAYHVAEALKYVEKNEIQKIMLFVNKIYNSDDPYVYDVSHIFARYYQDTLSNYDDENCDQFDFLNDYIFMVIKMKKTFNLKMKSINKLVEEHNRMAILYRAKYVKKISIPKDSPFLQLKLPPEYVLIKTKKALIEESVENQNCVAAYDTLINKGKCVIYSIICDKKRYTIEIRYKKQHEKIRFYINQFYGKKNTSAPEELDKKLKELIESENERINKRLK